MAAERRLQVGDRGPVCRFEYARLNSAVIVGELANTPPNLKRWITDPQGVEPGTAMPETGVPASTARDIAAYLYALH